ncbi:MAG: hypothetical protein J7501_18360, partial [Bdellovibrio sp.]|nr:hypothetical protein [Bdellovibrio sp.]
MTLLLTPFAFAIDGAVSGGGGRSVVCRNKESGHIERAELLDIFEAQVIFNLELAPNLPDLDKEVLW